MPRALQTFLGGNGGATEVGVDLCLIEEHLYLTDLTLIASTFCHLVGGVVITSDNLILGGIATHLFVRNTESHHIHSHVGGRLIWIAAVDTLEEGVEHGEYLDVAVVVDGNLVVGLKMEGVDHVHVVEVGSGCLVGDVHGVLQWEIPHGECLKLGISCPRSALVLIVKLTEAYCHFAASGA